MMKRIFGLKDILFALGPTFFIVLIAVVVAYKYIDPAPPKHLVIGAGDGEGDYETFAKLYRDILKEDGVELEVKPTDGTWENLKLLKDPKSNIEVGFVQDGLGS